MKKYVKLPITLLIIILFINSSCKKKEAYTYYIPQELKSYAIFQPGSYWVYKNEMTGMMDSSYINNPPAFSYIHLGEHLTDPIREICDIYYGDDFISASNLDQDQYSLTFRSWGSVCLMSNEFQPGFIYKVESNLIFKDIEIIDSLIINDNKYFHVLNTQFQSTSLEGDTITYIYYLVKSIGLIKCSKEVNKKDTTWSLFRYHINI